MKLSSIELIKKLKQQGFEAYWAGGCVRDILLGITPKDFDIVTSATPDQVEQLIDKTIPIGKKFGVILAEQDGIHFEIATFRTDSDNSDGRRPSSVEFKTAEEDAFRRDFTINGLFFDPLEDKIYDFIEGQKDIQAKLIRFIGDPVKRIQEDNLRILRAVRFKTVLDFQYHPDTYKAVKEHAHLIKNVSGERIRDELNKMLSSKSRVESLNDLEDLGLLEVLLPEIQALKGVAQPAEYHNGLDVYEHTMLALNTLSEEDPISLIWATLLHDSGKAETFQLSPEGQIKFEGHAEASANIAKKILSRLKFSSNFIKKVAWMCEYHMSIVQIQEMPQAAKIKWFLKPYFLELMDLHKADTMGIHPVDLTLHDDVMEQYRLAMSLRPDELPKLLDGNQIMKLTGISPGPKLKQIIDEIHDQQLEGKISTTAQAKEFLNQHFK